MNVGLLNLILYIAFDTSILRLCESLSSALEKCFSGLLAPVFLVA